jgi:hypothetical protein
LDEALTAIWPWIEVESDQKKSKNKELLEHLTDKPASSEERAKASKTRGDWVDSFLQVETDDKSIEGYERSLKGLLQQLAPHLLQGQEELRVRLSG